MINPEERMGLCFVYQKHILCLPNQDFSLWVLKFLIPYLMRYDGRNFFFKFRNKSKTFLLVNTSIVNISSC